MILTSYRKTEIGELAEAVSLRYFKNELIIPEVVATDLQITYSYGNYEDYFDGMLEHRSGKFHIYINLDRLTLKDSPRSRFTFAHELGHYYIDEHRNALKKGNALSHPSFNKLMSKNIVEREADFFASCFLAPSSKFRLLCLKRKLDDKLIDDLARHFQISVSACIFRYIELDLFPMILIYSKKGIVEWCIATNGFKQEWPRKGRKVFSSSAAGEFFTSGKKYLGKEIIFPQDWFENIYNKNQQLYEKSYYNSNNSVLSMIWHKEK